MGLCCQPGHMNSDSNCHSLPSALWLAQFVLTTLGSEAGFLPVEAVTFPLCQGRLELRRVMKGIECAGGHAVHRGLEQQIGASMEPRGSMWLPSLFLIPETQERAQSSNCLCTKCTEEYSGDEVMKREVDEQGQRKRKKPEYISGFGL